MDDLRIGALFRAARLRLAWRQSDVAGRAGVSRQTISRIERGHLGCSLPRLRRVAAILEVQIDVAARWRGGEGARLLSERHGVMAESVSRALPLTGWEPRAEVSFSIFGERGVIDLLAWHPASRTVLVIELKTEIVDVGELLATFGRKRRLLARVAREQGWDPLVLAAAVLVDDRTMNRRRVADHRATLRSELPADGRTLRAWLRSPGGPISALAFWRYSQDLSTTRTLPPVRRVRPRRVETPRPLPSVASGPATATAPPVAAAGRRIARCV
jgi:transcriptional regulator with XRE-family HTH domain